MSKPTGGPAFPSMELNHDGSSYQQHLGVSLRDYFAAHVNPGDVSMTWGEVMVGPPPKDEYGNPAFTKEMALWWADVEAKFRFVQADAMIKAREV